MGELEIDQAMLRPLREYFAPKKLPHREEQLTQLTNQFELYQNGKFTSNLFLRGNTGTGKTATLSHALQDLSSKHHVFVRGTTARTPTQVLRALTDSSYKTDFRLLQEAAEQFRFRPKIIIIDEVDKINRRRELFTHLNTIYRDTGVPIIIVSNVVGLLRSIPDDARLTLLFQNVNFEPYDANALLDILKERIEVLPHELRKLVPESALQYLCAKAAREADGSARVAREALLKCFQSSEFSQAFIDSHFTQIANQDWVDFWSSFTGSEKNFVKALLELHFRQSGKPFKAKKLQRQLPNLSPQRIANLITKFERDMVIETRMVNAGKGGRYRTIWFATPEMAERLAAVVDPLLADDERNGDGEGAGGGQQTFQ